LRILQTACGRNRTSLRGAFRYWKGATANVWAEPRKQRMGRLREKPSWCLRVATLSVSVRAAAVVRPPATRRLRPSAAPGRPARRASRRAFCGFGSPLVPGGSREAENLTETLPASIHRCPRKVSGAGRTAPNSLARQTDCCRPCLACDVSCCAAACLIDLPRARSPPASTNTSWCRTDGGVARRPASCRITPCPGERQGAGCHHGPGRSFAAAMPGRLLLFDSRAACRESLLRAKHRRS